MWQDADINFELIENNFVTLSDHIEEFSVSFFEELFDKYTETKELFRGIAAEQYQHDLVSLLDFLLSNIQEEEALTEKLSSLGKTFQAVGVTQEHFTEVESVFVSTLEKYLSGSWSEEASESWNRVIDGLIETIQDAYTPVEQDHVEQEAEEPSALDNETIEGTESEEESFENATEESASVMQSDDVSEETETAADETVDAQESEVESEVQDDITLLENSFELLSDNTELLVARFYERLFEQYPDVQPLFENADLAEQQKKLQAALVLVITNLRNPDQLTNALQDLGKKHQAYGAVEAHYEAVKENLLSVMQELAGDAWTDEINGAWSRALTEISEIMLEAYQESEVEMSNTVNENEMESIKQELDDLKQQNADMAGKISAIEKVQASIEFNLDGTIITANDNFLNTVGYSLDEIQGKHHSMFVDPEYSSSAEYKGFWNELGQGKHHEGQYRRINKAGEEVWINASYNPIFDANGEPYKVVKYATDGTELRAQQQAANRLQVAVDGCQSPMIMIDRDFIITYANNATIDLLTNYQDKFNEVWPSFDVNGVLGTCIDVFHKNPEHQRKLLADPSNLPYQTDIEINGLKFSLTVSAQMDSDGNYIGNTLEWQDVTEERIKETEVARLQSAVNGAQANLMLCDADLNITYANPAVIEMLRARQMELRQIWPGLDVDNLVGQNIDQFHKNPAHQRGLLSDPSRLPAKAEIKVGDLQFSVNATMVKGPDGAYMGNMVEWQDITEQKKAEDEIQALIKGAAAGELDWRMQDVEQYEGFMRVLGEGINSLMDSIVEPVKEVMRVLQSLSEGDLTQKMDGEYQGQFAEMRDSANASIENLFNMVNEIRDSSSNINTSATEIAQGNTDLSSRTEQQASALEETASTVEEMTGTVKQNADNAKQANQLASGARETAEKGGSVVNNAVTAMSEINSSSKKIADIIGVIDEIAFQTNLLALNAAVEAARAGEQGRGFAVVASEVRNLAQRSAAAAKEIKTLINDSVDKVEEGSRLVDESGQTLEEIVLSVKKVSDIIAEIAAAGEEQYVGIEQINKAVGEMDQMTQQNAALVEEAASASQAMSEQSSSLSKLVSVFNVGDSGTDVVSSSATQERRSPDRPWNDNNATSGQAQSAPAPQPRKAAAAGGDDEWEEF